MESQKEEPTRSYREALHAESSKGGGQMNGGRGDINGPAERDFRGRGVQWVAGRGWQGREVLGRAVESGGTGQFLGG